jgi:hypothetical protein
VYDSFDYGRSDISNVARQAANRYGIVLQLGQCSGLGSICRMVNA